MALRPAIISIERLRRLEERVRHAAVAGFGRQQDFVLALGVVQRVIQPRHHPRGVAEGLVLGDVLDPLAVDEVVAPVGQRGEVVAPVCGAATFTLPWSVSGLAANASRSSARAEPLADLEGLAVLEALAGFGIGAFCHRSPSPERLFDYRTIVRCANETKICPRFPSTSRAFPAVQVRGSGEEGGRSARRRRAAPAETCRASRCGSYASRGC